MDEYAPRCVVSPPLPLAPVSAKTECLDTFPPGDPKPMATNGNERVRERLEEILARRIMLLDGSMGALIYFHELDEEQFRGKQFAQHPFNLKNCTEVLVVSQPELIEGIHRAYLEAGADIIETDTFNGSA